MLAEKHCLNISILEGKLYLNEIEEKVNLVLIEAFYDNLIREIKCVKTGVYFQKTALYRHYKKYKTLKNR